MHTGIIHRTRPAGASGTRWRNEWRFPDDLEDKSDKLPAAVELHKSSQGVESVDPHLLQQQEDVSFLPPNEVFTVTCAHFVPFANENVQNNSQNRFIRSVQLSEAVKDCGWI